MIAKESKRFGKLATLAFAATALGALTIPLAPASAQMYLGWDFGNGVGVGIGTPPSAYEACPSYGIPVWSNCHYRPYYGYYR
ncbi:MAG TPA: hypothetical protein VME41_05335 [Stellaceae bacterium]|nr:hypothetical protein [Stellaceae bacterium]